MRNLFCLTDEQKVKLAPFLPKSHGKPRVDDRRGLNGIIFINRNGLRRHDGENANAIGSTDHSNAEYGSPKTLYSRWKRWSEKGISVRMLLELADQGGETDTLMIDAPHLKTHRVATSMRLKTGRVAV